MPGAWELYDLEADRTEMNDWVRRMPGKVKELETRYNLWTRRAGVIDSTSEWIKR